MRRSAVCAERGVAVVASLDDAISEVVGSGNCSGCGACCLLDPGLSMALGPEGFLRPVRRGAELEEQPTAVDEFRKVCPGRVVSSPRPSGAQRHPQLGSYLESWVVWATDPEARFKGASGGVLTALAAWLGETGRARQVLGAGPGTDPRRTVSLTITDRATALAAAGSRYAPFAAAADPRAIDGANAVIAKPCEASALSRLLDERQVADRPILLSFFCAGTPSQRATDDLVRELGVDDDASVTALRYRGCGWPGDFTVTAEGRDHQMDYRTSWGDRLGPTVQWRCKICPDGVGESADISVCDYWEVDEQGYPVFDDAEGRSGLLVRTERGRALVQEAREAGVIAGEKLVADRIAAIQPGQTWRRRNLFGRLAGARLAGARIPDYRGFPLSRLALANFRATIRAMRGSRRRARAMGLGGRSPSKKGSESTR